MALFSGVVFANDLVLNMKLELKKDEKKKIFVKYDDKKKLFEFRWTLYKDGALVVFRKYDRVVAQNVLYLKDMNQSFRFDLKSKGVDFYDTPYILVKFTEFKDDKQKAFFDLFLYDKNKQILLDSNVTIP